jgi:F-type H+-transporting ATPase subunit gamma
MGAQLRALRRQIRSVKSTAKITRAQELIATSRIVKAQERVKSSRPYAVQITRALSALISSNSGIDHPLLTERAEITRTAVLVITSDRGFCGGYNANVIREAEALIRKLRDEGKEPVPYVVGSKGAIWYRFSDRPGFVDAEGIGRRLAADFLSGTGEEGAVGEIHVVYTEFVSMLTQQVEVRRLIPLQVSDEEMPVAEGVLPTYDFEPSPAAALDLLLPNYIESRIYHMLLQAAASEHASRRRAMKSATDNANDLIGLYSRQANQARQAEITQEISEIVGGANALAESSAGSE